MSVKSVHALLSQNMCLHWQSRDWYAPRLNGKGGMTWPPTYPICLKVEATVESAEINVNLICPLRKPSFPPGTHEYDPMRHNLIEGVSKCIISRQETQVKFSEYRDTQGHHDEAYTAGFKIDKSVGLLWPNVLPARDWRVKILRTLLFATSWTSSWHWAVKVPMFISAGYQAIVALRKMSLPVSKGDPWPWHWPTGKSTPCIFKATGQLLYPVAGSNHVGCVSYIAEIFISRNQCQGHQRKFSTWPGLRRLLSPGVKLVILKPQSPISCPEELPLFATIVDRHWPLTTCCWSVQFYRKLGMNTALLTLWRPSLRQFRRLA